MPRPDFSDRIHHLDLIRRAALAAANPAEAVKANLALGKDELRAGPHRFALDPKGRVLLLGIGKAALAMSLAASDILGERILAGIVTVPEGTGSQAQDEYLNRHLLPTSIEIVPAGHPLVTEGSILAGTLALNLLEQAAPEDLVLVLISGGGSALFEVPAEGVSLQDLSRTYHMLIQSGAPIQSINLVRKALSQTKAGGLARYAAPAEVLALIMSDVVGDQLSTIASGPTVLHGVSPEAAREVLEETDLWEQVPTSVRAALSRPKPKKPAARRPRNVLIGTNRMVVDAAASKAEEIGFSSRVMNYSMQGEAREVGRRFARRLRRSPVGSCYLMGGETTVSVVGDGRGGRNQEFILAAGILLREADHITVMSIATDGIDGPTDAAGAWVDQTFLQRAQALGFDPDDCLRRNDAYPILDATDALVRTGLTGTNLNDLVVGLHYAK